MKLFLDANILVSVLNKEYPVFTYSSRIMSLTEYDHIHLYSNPICLAIAWYFAEKKSGRERANQKIKLLCDHLEMAMVDNEIVQETFHNKSVEDFEDGLEYYSAIRSGCGFIITENPDDFYFSEIPVLRAQEFLIHHVTIDEE